ncbi:MAG TPA: glycosyltransferase family 4 protein [Gemmatimonadaceae bacterium]|nr:glycosyltransferase family 4 protein [Gemmatimonadaceae bacterium]
MKAGVLLVGNFLRATNAHALGEDLRAHLDDRGWRTVTTSARRAALARLADMVGTAWRRRGDYAVAQVNVYSGRAFLWAEAVCATLRLARKPYILSLHGGNLPRFARRWPRRTRRLLRRAVAVTAPSPYLREHMRPYRGDVQLLPNPLELADYAFVARPAPRPRLVWLRAFHAVYDPGLAPRVVAELAADVPDVALRMIGPDAEPGSRAATAALARTLGVADRVTLLDKVPKREVPAALQRGDIFLNTARVDNTPVCVLEALACGLCVVSTNVGGMPYLLRHEHDALLVPPGDPVAMAGAVRRLLHEPGLAERLSRNGRRTAEQFAWDRVLPRWEALLTAAVHRVHRVHPGDTGRETRAAARPARPR